MAGNEEMVSSISGVPKRIPIGHESNVICNDVLQTITKIIDTGSVEVSDGFGDADGEEESGGLVGVAGQKGALPTALQLIYHLTFNGVYVSHWSIVK